MMMPRVGASLLIFALSGCLPLMKEAGTSPVPVRDPVELQLAAAAERAEAALTRLARIEEARTPAKPVPMPQAVPAELSRTVTLRWIGPFETLARKLAEKAGYRFSVSGARPSQPVIVDLRAEDRPLIAVLRDAALQAGTNARLTVDAGRRMMWVDFMPAGDGR